MSPNLRAVVAQMYRQAARNFSSLPPGSSSNGERVIVTGLKSSDSSLMPRKKPSVVSWVIAGYVGFVAWEIIESIKLRQRIAQGRKLNELRSQRGQAMLSSIMQRGRP